MLTLSISDIVAWTVDIFTLDIKKAPAVTPELIDSKFRITELDAVSTHGRPDLEYGPRRGSDSLSFVPKPFN